MNNRNTYGDQKKPNPRLSNSRQRVTMTANFKDQPNAFKLNQQNSIETNTRQINTVLHKISTENKRYSISTSLKPNQKTLTSIISSLLYSFDMNFDSTMIQIQNIIDIFKFMGYSTPINKSIFNPIGAPHTWQNCLQLLEWMANVAEYHFEFRMVQTQYTHEETLNEVIMRSFDKEEEDGAVLKFLQKHSQNDLNKAKDFDYQSQTLAMAITNLEENQPDLSVLQGQQKKIQNQIFRQKETVILIDKQNSKLLKKSVELEQECNTNQSLINTKDKINKELQAKITNQEITVQQAVSLQAQIKDFEIRINNLIANHQKSVESLMIQKNRQVDKFMELQRLAEEINKDLKVNSKISNLKVPEFSSNLMLNYSQKNFQTFKDKDKQLIWNKQEHKSIEKQMVDCIERLSQEKNSLTQLLTKKNQDNTHKKKQLEDIQKNIQNNLAELQQISHQISSKQKQQEQQNTKFTTLSKKLELGIKQINQKKKTNELNKKCLEQTIKSINKAGDFLKKYEKQCQKTLEKGNKLVNKFQENCIEHLNLKYKEFVDLNSQVQAIVKQNMQCRK